MAPASRKKRPLGFRAMLNEILAAVPGGSVYDTRYLAAPDVTQLTAKVGSDDVIQFINNGLASCPQQLYTLFGYSQGATVTNQVLQKLHHNISSRTVEHPPQAQPAS